MRITKKHLVDFSFWGILSINLLYLNGLFTSFFKVPAFFSPFILVFCIFIIFNTPKPKIYYNVFTILITFFVLYIFIGLLSYILYPENIHPKTSIFKLLRGYISSLLIYWALYQYLINEYYTSGKQRLIIILHKASFLILFPLFFTVFGKQLGLTEAMTYAKDYGDRQIGIFTNPNTTGLHANYVLCFCLYSLISDRKGKLLWLLLIPACFYAAFLSLSKAAMLMATLNLLLYILFNLINFHRLKLSSKLISIFSIAIIGFSSFYIYANFEKLVGGLSYAQAGRIIDAIQISQGNINDKTTSERSGIAELVFPMIKSHPIEGNGFGSFHRIIGHGLGVHNTALLIIGESGIIPLILYLVFILLFFLKSLKQKEIGLKYLFVSVLTTYILISFLTSHNALDERISNVIIGIFLVLINIRR
ncbi:MAG TPA: hypothetical protein PK047_01555 [Saprospiraceae bacterium]|nr:hypothetical protein [Saprospiraceae bacterium]HRP40805.1 hypothetical protein [Saprospiraceae bacterium]